jgi:hypothetical protein
VGLPGFTTAEQEFGSVPVVIAAGQLIVGGVISTTVKVVLHVLLLL